MNQDAHNSPKEGPGLTRVGLRKFWEHAARIQRYTIEYHQLSVSGYAQRTDNEKGRR